MPFFQQFDYSQISGCNAANYINIQKGNNNYKTRFYVCVCVSPCSPVVAVDLQIFHVFWNNYRIITYFAEVRKIYCTKYLSQVSKLDQFWCSLSKERLDTMSFLLTVFERNMLECNTKNKLFHSVCASYKLFKTTFVKRSWAIYFSILE